MAVGVPGVSLLLILVACGGAASVEAASADEGQSVGPECDAKPAEADDALADDAASAMQVKKKGGALGAEGPPQAPALAEEAGTISGAGGGSWMGHSDCLCVFDIDRTLTGKQHDTSTCPRNRRLHGIYDAGYGGGDATLSALANEGINSTFCNDCYLGVCSAGGGSGAGSAWNNYLFEHVLRSQKSDAHPEWRQWSYGTDVKSPFVIYQADRLKQDSVELIRQWYNARGVSISAQDVFFYGDRTENIRPFADYGLNAREISCSSRDWELYGGSGLVGYCGARPEEIFQMRGQNLCR